MSFPALSMWIKSQRIRSPVMKSAPIFYRNLEEALDVRRRDHALLVTKPKIAQDDQTIDFGSNDIVSLGATGRLREEFDREMASHPGLPLGACSSRVMDGNYDYLETVEQEIATFHGAEKGLIVGSGYDANLAIFVAIPRAGDVIVYDELVHASMHDGMQQSQASFRTPFKHNNVDSFRDTLTSVWDNHSLIRQGKRCVIIAVESVYSLDGDVCPLQELVEIAKEILPDGNGQFLVDEAHSTAIIGPRGAGLVSELGLEKEVAVRLHTFSKALASTGAIVLGNQTIRAALLNLARSVIFTSAPALTCVVAARSAYNLLKTGVTEQPQRTVQKIVKYFFRNITQNQILNRAAERGILEVPLCSGWEDRPFVTHCVPVWTRQRYSYWLFFHLIVRKFSVFPVEYPAVPKGQSRVKLTFHATNTEAQVDALISAMSEWATEMMDIEDSVGHGSKLPKAARQVYALMGDDEVDG